MNLADIDNNYGASVNTNLSDVNREQAVINESDKTVKKSCIPTKKLIFAKTHKTGSTTLQNIVFRFGEKNKLIFVLPKIKSHRFSLKSHFTIQMAELFSQNENVVFDIFAAHSRWNLAQVKILIPEGYTFTILRDPVDTFESYFSYMGVDRKLGVDINEFAWRFASGVSPGQVRWGRNKQL